jgi:hypothetical protein
LPWTASIKKDITQKIIEEWGKQPRPSWWTKSSNPFMDFRRLNLPAKRRIMKYLMEEIWGMKLRRSRNGESEK